SLCVHTTLISAFAWLAPPRHGWLSSGHASLPRTRLTSPTSGKVRIPPPRDPPGTPLGPPAFVRADTV
ncbi:unnamed protein product, partial [Lampetra planeri]